MTSRREFLSNTLGIGLAAASSASSSGRTTHGSSLTWDVFLAPSIPAVTTAEPFRQIDEWLGPYRKLWEARLDRFGTALAKRHRPAGRTQERGKKR
jgi:hypothetical protein